MPFEIVQTGDPRDDVEIMADNSQAIFDALRDRYSSTPYPEGGYPHMRSGAPVDPADFPHTAWLTRQRAERLPHWFYIGSWPTVSSEMRAAIEAVQPGVHQFIAVRVRNADETPLRQAVFYLNICRSVACLDPDGPHMFRYTTAHGLPSIGRKIPVGPWDLRRETITGLHLWWARDFSNGILFCSDEMQASMARCKTFNIAFDPVNLT